MMMMLMMLTLTDSSALNALQGINTVVVISIQETQPDLKGERKASDVVLTRKGHSDLGGQWNIYASLLVKLNKMAAYLTRRNSASLKRAAKIRLLKYTP